MNKNKYFQFCTLLLAVLLANACSQPGVNSPGSEYMPDMGHSVAVEANVYNYYYPNTWDERSTIRLKELSMPRSPIAGTIPRGYTGNVKASSGEGSVQEIKVPLNGSVPYHFPNTDAGRAAATAELIYNPFPITDAGLARAQPLYNVYCGICHGEKGDGNGYLVDEENPNAVYPAAPANLLDSAYVYASNGQIYHAIMHGKGVMGSYADKIGYEERWQVIHYIRSLQAKSEEAVYSEAKNTLNDIDHPASLGPIAENKNYGSSSFMMGAGSGSGSMNSGATMEGGNSMIMMQDGGGSNEATGVQGQGVPYGPEEPMMEEEATDGKKKKKLGQKIKEKAQDIKNKLKKDGDN